MAKRHNYKNLKIWKLGLEIANDILDLLLDFPKHERYDLSSSYELGTQLLVAYHRKYLNTENLKKLRNKIEEWQRMTMSFQNRLN